ncbi:MAG: feruloyl-CoA synthase [Paracoccaceae bacterium]
MTARIAHDVRQDRRADGTLLLRSAIPPRPCVANTGVWLHRWATEVPDRVFLAERRGAGWREESYAATLQQVRALAAALLGRGLTPQTPVAVLSGNGVDHGMLALAAQYVGIPIVPLAEQYSLIPEAHGRLVEALRLVRPGMIYVSDAARFAGALALEALAGIEIVASLPDGAPRAVTPFAELLKGDASADLDAAHAAVGPDTLAKILLTSGSTSSPKGVLTTQRMMCVNQAQIAAVLPFLEERPPVLLDWLPWNHVFGGSHNFNMMLAHGGSLYIDDGKPVKPHFARSVENLRMMAGTLAMNVPVGYALLLEALRQDQDLKRRFFADLDLIFYAGASLPAETWAGLERMATEIRGDVPLMISSWGMTETAPAAIMVHEDMGGAGVIGVPLPDVRVKLLPLAEDRFELRVAGPNIMPGYYHDPEKTAAAFDEEGFLVTGDAVKLRDPANPNAGLQFDGRTSEDFKLSTGTWVRAANLRLAVLGALDGLVQDVVVTGQDRAEIGLLVFPLPAALAEAGDGPVLQAPALAAEIAGRLRAGDRQAGSSMRVARALLMAEPPSVREGEITPKGSLNARRILTRRADLVARLYDDSDPDVIRI